MGLPRLQQNAHTGATLRMWQFQCIERRPERASSRTPRCNIGSHGTEPCLPQATHSSAL